MSNDRLDDIEDQQHRDYVAAQLGIDPATLDEYPYSLDESATEDGTVTAWLIYWDDEAPRGVHIEGNPGNSWSSIPPQAGNGAQRETKPHD